MKKLNTPVGIIFGLISLVNLVAGDWLSAGLNALLSAAFWLSDLTYAPAAPGTTQLTVVLPAWRRYASIGLMLVALALFGYQIGRDLKAKANRTTATEAK
jgi:hypothetical protein